MRTDRAQDDVVDGGRGGVETMEVELVLLRAAGDGVRYRTRRIASSGRSRAGRRGARCVTSAIGATPVVCHSTSSRFEVPGRLVLTYAALPDVHVQAIRERLTSPAVVSSGDATRPTPSEVHDHHVAAHAIRHLAHVGPRGSNGTCGSRDRSRHVDRYRRGRGRDADRHARRGARSRYCRRPTVQRVV